MLSTLTESKIKNRPTCSGGCSESCCLRDAEDAVKRIEKEIIGAKAAVSETIEDGKVAAERLLKRSQYAVQDSVTEVAHKIKHYPFRSLAVALAAGVALGILLPRPLKRN